MNAVFAIIVIISATLITFTAPDKLLACLLSGAGSALNTAATLFAIYAVWMGFSALAEESGLATAAAKFFKPVIKKIFRTDDETASQNLAMNLSCNVLGLGGAATPYAVKAISALEKTNNGFAQKLLFIINATSVQVIPSTVIALRQSAGSASAYDIFLPSLICTAISTALAAAIFLLQQKFAGRRKWST